MSDHTLIVEDYDFPETNPVHLTSSQQQVYDGLLDYGALHYSGQGRASGSGLKPRLYPLIAGPTGSGKSFLVERAAAQLEADYFRVTYGEWIPLGARPAGSGTMMRLARLLATGRRVVAHVDELDKWLLGEREWGRSLTTDLWNLLDAKIPWDQMEALEAEETVNRMIAAVQPGQPPPEAMPEENPAAVFHQTDNLWIVGSGTWQNVFEHRQARTISFQPGGEAAAATDSASIAEAIRTSKVIPTELSARFATDLLILEYPTPAETERLLEVCGLKQLAAEVGLKVTAKDVNYAVAGMRALESLKTRLLLTQLRQDREAQRKLMIEVRAGAEGPPF